MLWTVLITAALAVVGTLVLCGLLVWLVIYALARRMFGRADNW